MWGRRRTLAVDESITATEELSAREVDDGESDGAEEA
jgi:hypothetical protein